MLDISTMVVLTFLSLSIINTTLSLISADNSSKRMQILGYWTRHVCLLCITYLVITTGNFNLIFGLLSTAVYIRFPILNIPALYLIKSIFSIIRIIFRLIVFVYTMAILFPLRIAYLVLQVLYDYVRYALGYKAIKRLESRENITINNDYVLCHSSSIYTPDTPRGFGAGDIIRNCAEDYEDCQDAFTIYNTTEQTSFEDESTWPGRYYNSDYKTANPIRNDNNSNQANEFSNEYVDDYDSYDELPMDSMDYEFNKSIDLTDSSCEYDSLNNIDNSPEEELRSIKLGFDDCVHDDSLNNALAGIDDSVQCSSAEEHSDNSSDEELGSKELNYDDYVHGDSLNNYSDGEQNDIGNECKPADSIGIGDINRIKNDLIGISNDMSDSESTSSEGCTDNRHSSDRFSSLYNAFHQKSLLKLHNTLNRIQNQLPDQQLKEYIEDNAPRQFNPRSPCSDGDSGTNKSGKSLIPEDGVNDPKMYCSTIVEKQHTIDNEINSPTSTPYNIEQLPIDLANNRNTMREEVHKPVEINTSISPNNSPQADVVSEKPNTLSLEYEPASELTEVASLDLSVDSRCDFLPNSLLSRPIECHG